MLLLLVGLLVAQRIIRLVTLELQVEVLSEDTLEPLDALLRLIDVAVHNVLRYLSTEASRGGDDPLVVGL